MYELWLQNVPPEQSAVELHPQAPASATQTGASPPQPVLRRSQNPWLQVSFAGQSELVRQLPQKPPEQPGLS